MWITHHCVNCTNNQELGEIDPKMDTNSVDNSNCVSKKVIHIVNRENLLFSQNFQKIIIDRSGERVYHVKQKQTPRKRRIEDFII